MYWNFSFILQYFISYKNYKKLNTLPKVSFITSLYKTDKYLNSFFENYFQISNLNETELILIHNSPNDVELEIIDSWKDKIPHLRHLVVDRESLYKSWNRGIKVASGEYIAMWNVDDVRQPEGFKAQIELLEESNYDIVTGNYYKVFKFGETNGTLKKDTLKKSIFYKLPRFRNGCFLVWRKEIHNRIGYFDEQLKIVGDREFWYRSAKACKIGRVDKILGYYLRESNTGLSKTKKGKDKVEGAIVAIRYAYLYLINIYLFKYYGHPSINQIKNFDEYKNNDFVLSNISLRNIPSYFLFFFPWIKEMVVELRFMIIERIKSRKK